MKITFDIAESIRKSNLRYSDLDCEDSLLEFISVDLYNEYKSDFFLTLNGGKKQLDAWDFHSFFLGTSDYYQFLTNKNIFNVCIEFYDQGTMMKLNFIRESLEILIDSKKITEETIFVGSYYSTTEDLRIDFEIFIKKFNSFISLSAPELYNSNLFRIWQQRQSWYNFVKNG